MTLRCPNCRLEISAKEIVALESWRDDKAQVVRHVVLVCPGCDKPLTPSTGEAGADKSLSS